MLRDKAQSELIVTEGNFEELPLGRLNAGGTSTRWLEYEWLDDYESESGEIKSVKRRWVVGGSERYGLPGEKEQDVYVAILELISNRGGIPDDGVITFSLYELLEIMGDGHGGGEYRRLRTSLRTIARSTVESHRAFYSRVLRQYISDEFQIFTIRWSEIEDLEGNRLKDRHELLLHPYFAESYRENYAGRLNAEFYWRLNRPTSKRLYRLLDRNATEKREGGKRSWDVSLETLVGLMPLSVCEPARVKKVLDKAHAELVEQGFLDRVEYAEAGPRGRQKAILVKYLLNKKFAKRTFSKRIDLTVAQQSAVEQMRYWGLSRTAAIEWVLKKGVDHCEKWALLLHFQPNVDRRKSGGLLNKALQEEFDWWEENARNHLQGRKRVGEVSPDVLERAKDLDILQKPSTVESPTVPEDDVEEGLDDPLVAPDPDPEAAEVWVNVLDIVAEEINTPSFRVWFEGTIPTGWDGSQMQIAVPNSFAKEYIETRFKEMLLRGVASLGAKDPSLSVSIYERGSHANDGPS